MKHNNTCTMAFGRTSKHSDCPRCEELKNGAAPVKWAKSRNSAQVVDNSLKAYCFSVSCFYQTCTKENNPSCACGKRSYND